MGSPLTVSLVEIRVSHTENLAITNSIDPPGDYYHFVDDGFGHFRNRDHAENFLRHLNSLTSDLEYAIKYPKADGSIAFLDILIHANKSTSIYRKQNNTNPYTHYFSSTSMSSKVSTVRTLTRRAFKQCSPQHLADELSHLENTFLSNGYPQQKVRDLMQNTLNRLKNTKLSQPPKPNDHNLLILVSFPYDNSCASSIKKALAKYGIGTTFQSNHTLKSLLTNTKTPTPSHIQQNVIYKIPCDDYEAFYIGETCRPLIKRIEEHEAYNRLNNFIDSPTGNIKSVPAKHNHEHGHNIAWKSTTIIASCDHRPQLDLLEQAPIMTMKPPMNIQHKGPRVNACWKPLFDIASSFINKHANINIGS